MLISVILTTYKRPMLLLRAARSVLSQQLEKGVHLELIVSDDDPQASALSALAALESQQSEELSIKYLKRAGDFGGVAASRNRSLAVASGDWVVFLDDDDFLLDGAITALLTGASAVDADFCAGHYLRVQEDGTGRVIGQTNVALQWHGYEQLLLSNLFPIGSFAIRRSVINVPFNTNLRTHEDWLFLIDNLRRARVAILGQPVVQVRQAIDQSREHRNVTGGFSQAAADYARIYALHPAPHLVAQRRAILESYGFVDLDALIGGDNVKADRAPSFHETHQGRFLICNPKETIQAALLYHGYFEPLAARIAAEIVPLRPGTVVDVGAHIGVFSIPVARALPTSHVICIEPQRMVFMHLCANLLANHLRNTLPINLAVGLPVAAGETVAVPFFDVFAECFTGSVSLDNDVQRVRGLISGVAEPSQWADAYDMVPLKSLDEIASGLNVTFVKVDVEGMELQVLRSGENLLRMQRPSLFFEAWTLAEFETQRHELIVYVRSLGYVILQVQQDCFAFHPEELPIADVLKALTAAGCKVPDLPSG